MRRERRGEGNVEGGKSGRAEGIDRVKAAFPFYIYILQHFFTRADHVDQLLDAQVCCQIVMPDLDVHWILLAKVQRQLLHVLRPGRREQQRLPVWPDLPHDLPDLRLKSHVCSHQQGCGA